MALNLDKHRPGDFAYSQIELSQDSTHKPYKLSARGISTEGVRAIRDVKGICEARSGVEIASNSSNKRAEYQFESVQDLESAVGELHRRGVPERSGVRGAHPTASSGADVGEYNIPLDEAMRHGA